MAVALTLTLIFCVEVGRCVWLACLAVGLDVVGESGFSGFYDLFLLKRFTEAV